MKAMYGEEPRTRPPLPDGFLKTDAEMEKVCGKQFACGTSHNAHDVIGNPDAVMKKMKLKSPATNFSEQLIWSSLQGTDMEKEFGQILGISQSGKYLPKPTRASIYDFQPMQVSDVVASDKATIR
jgi:hypothetical protein